MAKEDKDLQKNQICWVLGTERPVITHVPIGIKPIDRMADFCLSDEGEQTMEEIKKRLSKFS